MLFYPYHVQWPSISGLSSGYPGGPGPCGCEHWPVCAVEVEGPDSRLMYTWAFAVL